MKEVEIWGIIPAKLFPTIKARITKLLGKPVLKRRLSIEISDWDNKHLDTRIRITDGYCELVQKVGAWNNNKKEEIAIPLQANTDLIYGLVRVLTNYVKEGNPRVNIYQYENLIFDTPLFELKLSKQYGKGIKYNFEIEAHDEAMDLYAVAEDLKLEPYTKDRDIAFWDKWNKVVSINGLKTGKSQYITLLNQYINID